MVLAPWTAQHNTPNKSVRQNVARRGVVLHHAALTNLDTLRRLELGAKEVSSTAIIKDSANELMMPLETFRAWSLSSAFWDSSLRSVETCNQSTDGWTVSDESHWNLARAVAFWSADEGWYPHRNGVNTSWTVLGHREVYTIHGASYGTACPGGMDLGLVTARAQALRGGASAPISQPPISQPAGEPTSGGSVGPILRSGSDWAYRRPTGDLAKRIVRELIVKGRLPSGYPNDGDPGTVFDVAIQKTLNASGMFIGLEDGRPERGGCYGVQDYAIKFGNYTGRGGTRDGRPEGLSWSCFADGLPG